MSAIYSHPSALSARGSFGARLFSRIGQRTFAAIWAWRTNMRQRRELLMFNEVELHELSLTAADVNRETSRPFWESISLTGR